MIAIDQSSSSMNVDSDIGPETVSFQAPSPSSSSPTVKQLGLDQFFSSSPYVAPSPPICLEHSLPSIAPKTDDQMAMNVQSWALKEAVVFRPAPRCVVNHSGVLVDARLLPPQVGRVPEWPDSMMQWCTDFAQSANHSCLPIPPPPPPPERMVQRLTDLDQSTNSSSSPIPPPPENMMQRWTDLDQSMNHSSLPIPPPPEHVPSVREFVRFHPRLPQHAPSVDHAPGLAFASAPREAQPQQIHLEPGSRPRRSGAIRWADLEIESEDSEAELQLDLDGISPASAVSTGVSSGESPARHSSPVVAGGVSKSEVDNAAGEDESNYGKQQPSPSRPKRRGTRGRGRYFKSRSYIPAPATQVAQAHFGDGPRESCDESRSNNLDHVGRQDPEPKYSSIGYGFYMVTPKPQNVWHGGNADQAVDALPAEANDELLSCDVKCGQTSVRADGPRLDQQSKAESVSIAEVAELGCTQPSSRYAVLSQADSDVNRIESCAVAVEAGGKLRRPRKRGPRVPRPRRPNFKFGYVRYVDGICAAVSHVRGEICTTCGHAGKMFSGISHRICADIRGASNTATDKVRRFLCYVLSHPWVSLLILLTCAIYLGKLRFSGIVDVRAQPPIVWDAAPYQDFRTHADTSQYCDRCAACAAP